MTQKKFDFSKLKKKEISKLPDFSSKISLNAERGVKGIALDKEQFDIDQNDEFVVLKVSDSKDNDYDDIYTRVNILQTEKVQKLMNDDVDIQEILKESFVFRIIDLEISSKYDVGDVVKLPDAKKWYIVFKNVQQTFKNNQNWVAKGFELISDEMLISV